MLLKNDACRAILKMLYLLRSNWPYFDTLQIVFNLSVSVLITKNNKLLMHLEPEGHYWFSFWLDNVFIK